MKKPSILALLVCAAVAAQAQQPQYVAPHVRTDGTYVPGYYRTQRDDAPNDNYGDRGNYNSYSGGEGRRSVETIDGVHGTYNGRAVINQGGQWYYARQ